MTNTNDTTPQRPSAPCIPRAERIWPPELMTEDELIEYLRIPTISAAKDHHNVIENLKRMHGLPRLHLCNKVLYPLAAVRKWTQRNTTSSES